ncbi:MAG: ABC transporter ATP-binding protein [Acidimicrobiaceae bacterium]|nr:ABC transporter ATP-binding protein [Acidimicrobiaceae bacterium]
MSRVVLSAKDVDITYRTYLDSAQGLRMRLKSRAATRRFRDIHAVRRLSFDMHEGESIGIIGHNGAGKSTVLLGLAGLVELTNGEVLAKSRPALLGVGAVMNELLSGQRNVEMGCLALGVPKREVDARVDQLITFAGLEEFADVPLRAYSSGMRARLAFTVATAAVPDILLIDEALAVGDKDFHARAVTRLNEIRAAAGAMVIVSHSMSEIQRMCDRVVWMDHGKIVRDGPAEAVVAEYQQSTASLSNRPIN